MVSDWPTRLIAAENKIVGWWSWFWKERSWGTERIAVLSTWLGLVLKEGEKQICYCDSLKQKQKIKYRKVKAKGKESHQLRLSQTPSGGKVADRWRIKITSVCQMKRLKCLIQRKKNDPIIHFTPAQLPCHGFNRLPGKWMALNGNIRLHHFSHASHARCIATGGRERMWQKGSMVNDQYLRFDFSHFAKMTNEEIAKVEPLWMKKTVKTFRWWSSLCHKEEGLLWVQWLCLWKICRCGSGVVINGSQLPDWIMRWYSWEQRVKSESQNHIRKCGCCRCKKGGSCNRIVGRTIFQRKTTTDRYR